MTVAKKKPKRSKATPLRDRFQRQVGDEATLRFNPERSQLRGALQDALGQLGQEVNSARGTAQMVQQSAAESRPVLQGAYGRGQDVATGAQMDINAATGGTPLAPGAARDLSGTKARLAESLAQAMAETAQRQSEAASGASFAINNAQDRYGRNVDKIQTRLGGLSQEEGAFQSGRLGELLGEDRKLRHDTNEAARARDFTGSENQKNRDVTLHGQGLAHEDRVAAAKTAAKDKTKSTMRTPEGQTAFRNSVSKAMQSVRAVSQGADGLTRGEARALFLNGVDRKAHVDEKKYDALKTKGLSDGEAKRRATVPAKKVNAIDELQLRVALDMAYDGHVSPETHRLLNDAGIKVAGSSWTTNRNAPRPRGVRPKGTPRGANRPRPSPRRRGQVQSGFFPPISLGG